MMPGMNMNNMGQMMGNMNQLMENESVRGWASWAGDGVTACCQPCVNQPSGFWFGKCYSGCAAASPGQCDSPQLLTAWRWDLQQGWHCCSHSQHQCSPWIASLAPDGVLGEVGSRRLLWMFTRIRPATKVSHLRFLDALDFWIGKQLLLLNFMHDMIRYAKIGFTIDWIYFTPLLPLVVRNIVYVM
jgi:hypothetical protein